MEGGRGGTFSLNANGRILADPATAICSTVLIPATRKFAIHLGLPGLRNQEIPNPGKAWCNRGAAPCFHQAPISSRKEDGRRDFETAAESLNVYCVQLALAGKDFRDNTLAAKVFGDIALAEAVAVQEESQHLGGRGLRHFEVLRFVALDQESEQFDGFKLSGCGMRLSGEAIKLSGVGSKLLLATNDVRRAALNHSGRVC